MMGIKEQKKTVYTCSDGREFTSHTDAKDHEFDINYKADFISSDPVALRKWLNAHKNFVLDYIGTQYDPEEDRSNG